MNVLVLGAGGYIGIPLVQELVNRGNQVKALDRFFFGQDLLGETIADGGNPEIIQDDLRFLKREYFDGIDCVFDLGGLSNDPSCDLSPDLTKEINAKSVEKNGLLAKSAGVERYIYFSSCSVYGATEDEIADEKSGLAPVSAYAEAKIFAEQSLFSLVDHRFAVTCMRNATVFGCAPRMRFDLVVNLMTKTAFEKGHIYVLGSGTQWRPLVHVLDVVKAALIISEAERDLVCSQAFNVGSTEMNYRVTEIAHQVRNAISKNIDILTIPDDKDKRSYRVDFSKINKVLGFVVCHSIADTVTQLYRLLESGKIDAKDPRWYTLPYYKKLIADYQFLKKIVMYDRIL
jgi:nucleoside-diphosphate-sugar epimerase